MDLLDNIDLDTEALADIVSKGAPLLGSLIGTPATGAAIGMIAKALGTDADPGAIKDELTVNPEATNKLAAMEHAHERELMRMNLEAQTARLGQVNRTIRAEAASNDAYVRRWRPTFGYLVAVAWALQAGGIAWVMATQPEQAGSLAQAVTALTPMWSVALAILGINVRERSKDKQVAAGQRPASFMGAIAKRIAG